VQSLSVCLSNVGLHPVRGLMSCSRGLIEYSAGLIEYFAFMWWQAVVQSNMMGAPKLNPFRQDRMYTSFDDKKYSMGTGRRSGEAACQSFEAGPSGGAWRSPLGRRVLGPTSTSCRGCWVWLREVCNQTSQASGRRECPWHRSSAAHHRACYPVSPASVPCTS
jgi:hypothetical protein